MFFGRLKWLIDKKVRLSWDTPADPRGSPGMESADPRGSPGMESAIPGRTRTTAHAFRMTLVVQGNKLPQIKIIPFIVR